MAKKKSTKSKKNKKFQIAGRVIDSNTKKGIPDLRVEAWDKDVLIDDFLGSDLSGKSGNFTIKFDKRYYQEIIFDRKPDIYFKVYKDNKLILNTEKNIFWNVSDPDMEIVLKVSIDSENAFKTEIKVKGTVSTDAKSFPSNITVQIVNKHVLDETVVGSTTPDMKGNYEVFVSIESAEQPAIKAKVIDQEGNTLAVSNTIFDITDTLTLDIFIPAGNMQSSPEYIIIQQNISKLIGNVSVVDITREQLDLISGKTRLSTNDLVLYQKAHIISRAEDISSEILYGLFRKGLPPKLSSLYEMSSLDLRGMIAKAVEGNIISPQDEKEVSQTLEKIQRYALNNVLNEPLLVGGTTFHELLQTSSVPENVISKFVQAVEEHSGTTDQLWENMEQGNCEIEPAEAAKLKFSVQAGSLSLGHLPMANSIIQLKNNQVITDISDLISWDKEQWINYLTEEGGTTEDIIPERIPGNTLNKKRQAYALAISRILEQTYPTESLAVKIEADENSNLKLFSTFVSNNPGFQIGETNIDTFLEENEGALSGIENPEQFTIGLKKLQLQYMLSPGFDRYESIKILQKIDIGSSVDIVDKGWEKFSSQYMGFGGSKEMAGVAYEMAAHNVAMMQNVEFIYGADLMSEFYVTDIPNLSEYTDILTDDDPDLATLFGNQDYCRCKHCRSIYGPAAYMVDILQFLSKADSTNTTYDTALKLLFERRPDLCHVDLNCENTNTAMPYIDLLNEIFENAVYKQATENIPDYSEYQTIGTTEELLAQPEHVRIAVYDNILKTSVYPWTMPFDLWTEEARIYLEHLKLPRYKILDAFLREEGNAYLTNESTVNEILKLSLTDREIITGNSSATNKALWGIDSRGSLVSILKNPYTLLDHSGMEYSDLKELLKTWFINPEAQITIEYNEGCECDLEKAEITNLTGNILMKILYFIRLKNKLGWSIRELDMALKTFNATSITDSILLKLSHIIRLKDYTKAPLYQILTFWGKIYTGHPNDEANKRSPYELLFLNKSVINPVDQAFKLNTSLTELADTTNNIGDHTAAVKAGLGISSTDLDVLIDKVLPDDTLNMENLSILYRHVIFSKSMKLKVNELILLKDLFGADPSNPDHTENIIIFLSDYEKIKKSKFKIVELEYLLQKEYDISFGVGLPENVISDMLTDIHLGLKKITDENQFNQDPQGEITTGKLATLLSDEDLNITLAILDKTSELDVAAQTAFVTDTLGFFLNDTTDAVGNLINPSTLTDKQSRYEYILKDLLVYLSNTGIREFLKQKIASNMGLDVDVASSLLFKRITGPDDPVSFAGETLQEDAFITTENKSIERSDFPAQFNTYVLLHKTALILNKFEISSDELDYLFAGTFDDDPAGPANWEGWFAFNELPVKTEGTPQDLFAQLLRLCDLFLFYNSLPSSDENLFEVMRDSFDPASTTTIAELLGTISSITRWELEDISELSSNVFGYSKVSYKNEIPFIRLKKCMDILKLTGAKAVDVKTWAGENLTSIVSKQIIHSVKALYEEKEWLSIARPLRDRLREKQLLALREWLVHNQPGIINTFELYSYYLADPEMSSCMLTSRIRLALSSIQLFAQRCLMNLEKEVDISNEDLELWGQWKWMKTYRIWEANRKIFCYPENWIEPELRDNKSEFFKEMEQELEQVEINKENVEKAYINYLTKLEAVSNMDIMAVCKHKEDLSTAGNEYYLFGRTVGEPSLLYFRKHERDNTWTSWKRIDIDFEGDHLIPIVYNNKLYIFWPVFTTKTKEADIPDANEKGAEPKKYREIQMAWSVYTNGKWSAKRVTEEKIDELDNDKYKDVSANLQYKYGTERYYVSKQIDYSNNSLVLKVFERFALDINMWFSHIGGDFKDYMHVGTFTFNPSMKVSVGGTTNEIIYLDTIGNSYVVNQEFSETLKYSWLSTNSLKISDIKLMKRTPPGFFSVTYSDTFLDCLVFNFLLPFVYQDKNRTFLIRFDWGKSGKFIIRNHYHPFISDFMNVVNAKGVEGLLDPEYNALDENALSNKFRQQQAKKEFFVDFYGERSDIVHENLPVDEIDFSYQGAYSIYNWELFFHIPMLIANKLSLNQKFEEAQRWYQYIFDPTDTSSEYSVPQCYWKIKPFVEIYDETQDGVPASIQQLLKLLNEGDEDLETQVDAWRETPFNPHLIARMRITAYQKNVVMKYIDNLLGWADMLFRQDTMETTNEATQLYLLAWYILGEEPRMIEGKEPESMTYCELKEEGIDDFSNAMVNLEVKLIKYFGNKYMAGFQKFKNFMLNPQKNYEDSSLYNESKLWFTNPSESELHGTETSYRNLSENTGMSMNISANSGYNDNITISPDTKMGLSVAAGIESLISQAYWADNELITHTEWDSSFVYRVVKTLYFCIPHNDVLLEYWSTVKDRIFKLRNCMNIEGVVRQLPLFEPPIDPGMLVKAVAAGMDLSSALNDLNASLPNYRFYYMIDKAKEFTGIVKNTGNLLLSVLEKRDAEALALLSTSNGIELLKAIQQIKKFQLEEAEQNRKALQESWNMAKEKYNFYENRERINPAEKAEISLMSGGIALQLVSQILNLAASVCYEIPNTEVGAAGWAGSPVTVISFGGQQFGDFATAVAKGLNDLAGTLYQSASLSGIIANIQRRTEDWDFIRDQAETEIEMIKHQIDVAIIRSKIAQADIDNHEKQIEQREAEYEYMKSKFTNRELYDWMTGQIASLYFQAYQMAYDLAKRAERSYKFELADNNDTFISYGYWDSLKKGLLAGEKLQNDLLRMEASYLEKNKRTYELTKHVSLCMLNPFALMQLRENGTCFFNLAEEIFDLDHPGHYMRRIKSVSITIPCVAGPYSGVNAKLTLLSNSIRKTTEVGEDPDSYPKRIDETDERFIENLAMIQSIATSNAQNDSGLFVLDFNDMRYLPFEGAGVISSWQLELPETFRSFDYNTINDVIVTINYTSKDGGDILKTSAEGHLSIFTQNSEKKPLEQLFVMKNDFSNEWHRFFNPADDEDGQNLTINIKKMHFPYMFHRDIIHVATIDIILQLKNPSLYSNENGIELHLTYPGTAEALVVPLTSAGDNLLLNSQPVNLGLPAPFAIEEEAATVTLEAKENNIENIPDALQVEINGRHRLNKEQIENMFIIIHYYTEPISD